jgi:hypothetical protein
MIIIYIKIKIALSFLKYLEFLAKNHSDALLYTILLQNSIIIFSCKWSSYIDSFHRIHFDEDLRQMSFLILYDHNMTFFKSTFIMQNTMFIHTKNDLLKEEEKRQRHRILLKKNESNFINKITKIIITITNSIISHI